MNTNITLPPKDFYTLKEVSERWGCKIEDVEHLIYEQGLLRPSVRLENVFFFPWVMYGDTSYDNEADNFCYLEDVKNKRYVYGSGVPLEIINPELKEILSDKDFIYFEKECLLCKKTVVRNSFSRQVSNFTQDWDYWNEELSPDTLVTSIFPTMFDDRRLEVVIQQEVEISDDTYETQTFRGFIAFNINRILITFKELNRFEDNYLNKTTTQKIHDLNNSATTRKTKTLQKLVLGMAMSKYSYKPGEDKQSSTGENNKSIHSDLELLQEHGLSLHADTIRKALSEAEKAVYKKKT